MVKNFFARFREYKALYLNVFWSKNSGFLAVKFAIQKIELFFYLCYNVHSYTFLQNIFLDCHGNQWRHFPWQGGVAQSLTSPIFSKTYFQVCTVYIQT